MGLEETDPRNQPNNSLTLVLDRHADAAWPAAERQFAGPWVLRAASGVTQRANSVLTSGPQLEAADTQLDAWIHAAEAFYIRRNLPPMFYLSPAATPQRLSGRLIEMGYTLEESAEVWTVPADRPAQSVQSIQSPHPVTLLDQPDAAWIDCAFDQPTYRRQVQRQIVQSITQRRIFASIHQGSQTVSCGMAVAGDGGLAGIYCMHTHPAHRRKGCASAILAALARWAIQNSATMLYLQLVSSNQTARSLYRRCGFEFAYPFGFYSNVSRKVKPGPPSVPADDCAKT